MPERVTGCVLRDRLAEVRADPEVGGGGAADAVALDRHAAQHREADAVVQVGADRAQRLAEHRERERVASDVQHVEAAGLDAFNRGIEVCNLGVTEPVRPLVAARGQIGAAPYPGAGHRLEQRLVQTASPTNQRAATLPHPRPGEEDGEDGKMGSGPSG